MTVADTKELIVSTQQGPLGVIEALVKLTGVLADAEKRAAFARDSDAAMRDAGIPPGVIPEPAMTTFSAMSEDELAVVAKVCEDLKASGLYINLPGDDGSLCFL